MGALWTQAKAVLWGALVAAGAALVALAYAFGRHVLATWEKVC